MGKVITAFAVLIISLFGLAIMANNPITGPRVHRQAEPIPYTALTPNKVYYVISSFENDSSHKHYAVLMVAIGGDPLFVETTGNEPLATGYAYKLVLKGGKFSWEEMPTPKDSSDSEKPKKPASKRAPMGRVAVYIKI